MSSTLTNFENEDQVKQHLATIRKQIAREEDTKIEAERLKLQEKLEQLKARKRVRINERISSEMGIIEATWTKKKEENKTLFCCKCELLYEPEKESKNRCAMDGCDAHKRCPSCSQVWMKMITSSHFGYDYVADEMEKSAEKQRSIRVVEYWAVKGDHPVSEGLIDLREEVQEWPNKDSGYVECWICKQTFCNQDFKNHYQECRDKVSSLCGFRAPTPNNRDYRGGSVCVPGHCGKKVDDPMKAAYCYPEDALCGTLCCSECVDVCAEGSYDDWDGQYYECGQKRCKECAECQCIQCED